MSRKMPRQKPHRSKQDYGSPDDFLAAVRRRFGPIVWDLAAHTRNSICGDRYFGPGSRFGKDTYERAWDQIPGVRAGQGLLYFNPEYGQLRRASHKCHDESDFGVRMGLLCPASVATEWFARWIEGSALVLPLRPRLTFKGTPINPETGKPRPYIKDLMFCVWGPDIEPGFETWRWDRAPAAEDAA